MKRIHSLFSTLFLSAFFVLTAMGCEEPEAEIETPRQQAAKKFANIFWNSPHVFWNHVDLKASTEQYQDFFINFTADTDNPEVTGGRFTVVNGGYAFPLEEGSWEFVGEPSGSRNFSIRRIEEDVVMKFSTKPFEEDIAVIFNIPEQSDSNTTGTGTSGSIHFVLSPAE